MVPNFFQLPDATRPCEERFEHLAQKVVMRVTWRMHPVLKHADQSTSKALLNEGIEAIACRVFHAVARDVIISNNLCDAILGAKKLILRPDNIHGRNCHLSSNLTCLGGWSEVAVFHTKRIDKPAEDTLAIALVIKSSDGHCTFRRSTKKETLNHDPRWQALDEIVELVRTQLVAFLVQFTSGCRIRQYQVGLSGISVGPASFGAIDQVICPIIHVVSFPLQGLQVLVPHFPHGGPLWIREVVRSDDQEAHAGTHSADAHVVPTATT
mmetsp:Transcript_62260/g.133910  ORF Transcript_62260/g.133910 Transcript_62260/m.133910 type:complete len:267 (+) Transcript_62260:550-1350(+)